MRAIVPILMAIACRGLYAQPADAHRAFEVASIKPSAPLTGNGGPRFMGMTGGPGSRDPGRFTCSNCSLSMLVTQAYDIQRYQLTGPSWLDTERFDITAKVPEGATKEQFRLMQQDLLAERFKLTLHHEKKEMPLYELVIGKNGPKLKESAEDPAPQGAGPAPGPPPPPGPPKIDKDGYPVLHAGRGTMMVMMNGRARVQFSNQTMEQFVRMLSGQLRRPVTDATGLKSKYDFALFWTSENMGMAGRGGLAPPPDGGAPLVSLPDSDSGPTLFGALQEQLGLKLEQKKGPVDILVIDHMEKVPTEN